MAKITYANKSYLNQNASVPASNKIQDVDMNEIKTVVNTNDDNVGDITTLATNDKSSVVNAINELKNADIYSTSEVKTNKVWMNKPVYRKVVQTGVVNSTGNQTFNHNISNLETYTKLEIYGRSGATTFSVPFASNQGMFSGAAFSARTISTTQVQLYIGQVGYSYDIIIEYTKTTD